MDQKPVVVYVEPREISLDSHNPQREALAHFLECVGCMVTRYEYAFQLEKDTRSVLKKITTGSVIMVIVKYLVNGDEEVENVIHLVRSRISRTMPIVVVCDNSWDMPEKAYQSDLAEVYSLGHCSKELVDFVERAIRSWRPPSGYFGADTGRDQALLLNSLEYVYRHHQMGEREGERPGIPDHNSMAVFEALRLRLLPVELLREEFDEVILARSRARCMARIPPLQEAVARGMEQIRKMNDEERVVLGHKLQSAIGRYANRFGCIIYQYGSMGDSVGRLVFDPRTGLHYLGCGFGAHSTAILELGRQVSYYDEMMGVDLGRETARQHFVSGLVFFNVEGFDAPIIELDLADVEETAKRKFLNFIFSKTRYIPVTPDGHLIE